jgi:hypothetical protein
MTRKKGWLPIAARAHEALVQHHRLLADQARRDAVDAEQHRVQASSAVTALSADWSARRRQGVMDPTLDHAYIAFHGQLSRQEAAAENVHREAQASLDRATAALHSAHGTSQVLDELLARREIEQAIAIGKSELQVSTESWLLANQHQLREQSE